MKANSHPGVVTALTSVVDGLEVASGGELTLARAAGARHIAFGGPAKTDADLGAAVDCGALIHAESVHELRRLALIAPGTAVALRVNRRGAGLPGSPRMTGVPPPFGIDETQLAEAVAVGLPVIGFHLHAVSNNLDAAAHAAYIRDCLDWSRRTAG